MRYRQFGRTGWEVSEIGYGDVGMAGWSNSDDHESLQSLQTAVNRGCNFFDTAYAYGEGRSENLLGQTVRANRAISGFTQPRRYLLETNSGRLGPKHTAGILSA